jgi:hypothetical protein
MTDPALGLHLLLADPMPERLGAGAGPGGAPMKALALVTVLAVPDNAFLSPIPF